MLFAHRINCLPQPCSEIFSSIFTEQIVNQTHSLSEAIPQLLSVVHLGVFTDWICNNGFCCCSMAIKIMIHMMAYFYSRICLKNSFWFSELLVIIVGEHMSVWKWEIQIVDNKGKCSVIFECTTFMQVLVYDFLSFNISLPFS